MAKEKQAPPPPQVEIFVLPGGRLPQRMSEGAIGYDAYIRAVVSPFEMEEGGVLRKTLFDFLKLPEDPRVLAHVQTLPCDELVYRLGPGESVLVGIGFATAMPQGMLYWVAPRSGLASKYRITLANAPGTVDPDYRGEAGVIVVNEGSEPFVLRQGMRIAQVIFQWAILPKLMLVASHQDLDATIRGAGGFGSTGLGGGGAE